MAHNLERVHEFYHDDVVVEFPQSGERIGGSTTYTNSGRIIPLKLLLKSCEFVVLPGWLRWIKTVFERGKINEIWKNIELEN